MFNQQPSKNYNHQATQPTPINQFASVPIPFHPAETLFSDMIKHWLRVKYTTLRPNTYDIYNLTAFRHIIPYFDQLGLSVQAVKTIHIQDYLLKKTHEGIKPTTLKKHYTIINGTLEYAMYNLNYLWYNPAYAVIRPRVEPAPIVCYNEEELNELLKLVKGHKMLEAPIHIASNLGLRRSEVLALRWDDIDTTEMKVNIWRTVCRVGKVEFETELTKLQSSRRCMPLSLGLKEFLCKEYANQKKQEAIYRASYNKNRLVCKRKDGNNIGLDSLSKGFTKFIQNHGLKEITFHDLRHSSASVLINAGFDVYQLSEWLGHADIRTTTRYLHLLFTTKTKMAEYMDKVLYNTEKHGMACKEFQEFKPEIITGGKYITTDWE